MNPPRFVACLGLLLPTLCGAQEPLREILHVESVRVEVTWIETRAAMDAKRREYGRAAVGDHVIRTSLEGFSVLGKRDGEFVCLIFAPKPARFDDNINTTLGHELLHCFGFSHD